MNKNISKTCRLWAVGCGLLLTSCVDDTQLQNGLSQSLSQVSQAFLGQAQAQVTDADVRAALKEALMVGTNRTISALSHPQGFWDKADIKIPLPQGYERLHTTLNAIGLGHMTNDIHLKLNQAASAASARAKPIFINAITGLTFEDAYTILQGGNTAATDLLHTRTKAPLTQAFTPVVKDALQRVGVLKEIENTRRQLQTIPFASYLAPQLNQDIADYAVEMTLKGLFTTLAQEETAIRQNPVKQTTELLQKVFALQG